MRKFRFYTDRKNLRPESSVKLDDFEAQHARKALRLKKDDEIFIFNGEKEYKSRITHLRNDLIMAEIIEEVSQEESEHHITVIQSLTKANSFEEVIEKTTELGVRRIIPMQTDFSVIKLDYVLKKYERWNKIIVSACKQSERIIVPELVQGIMFKELESIIGNFDIFIVCVTEDVETTKLHEVLKNHKSSQNLKIAYMIGPEGGFSPSEIETLKKLKVNMVSISDKVLRSETAAIVALTQILYELK